jgi:hypothetical protein
MIFENTGFSVEHWARFSEEDFIRLCKVFDKKPKEVRDALLKIAYQLIQDEFARTGTQA